MFIGQSVTVLGNIPGVIKSIRAEDGIVIIEPTAWKLANNCTPVFYMNPKDVKTLFSVDDMVSCTFGKGQIKEIRSDGVHRVTLANWALADGKSPVLYMQESALTKYVPKVEAPAKINYVEQCLTQASQFKAEATEFYRAGNFDSARSKYLESLGAMHYLNADLTNSEKASVFELSVPCHNNIALCCLNTERFAECIGFSKNCLLLVSSLEEKICFGGSEVWKCLQTEKGVTMEKLHDWKRKALFYMGKAELKTKDFESAIDHLEQALALAPHSADSPKVKEMLDTARKHRAAELKREKSTWSKAFKNAKAEQEAEDMSCAASSPASSPAKPATTASPTPKVGATADAIKSSLHDAINLDVKSILGNKANSTAVSASSGGNSVLNWVFGGTSLMILAVGLLGFGNIRDTLTRLWRRR